jgi:Icc-related predicted phosphoesterase
LTQASNTLRVAAMADVHYAVTSAGALREAFARAAEEADLIVIAGDLTDYGLPEEAKVLAADLSPARVPIIALLGNHDHHSGKAAEVTAVLREAGITILDGDTCQVKGLSVAGVKGFAGGFGRATLGFWGEQATKDFVQEGINEALKLEAALAKAKHGPTLALLHYAPIAATVAGEPPEIHAFLGTSRLEEPLTRYPVHAVVHGHAHKGAPEGQLSDGTPVYNVSVAVLRDNYPDRPPYRIIEVPLHDA